VRRGEQGMSRRGGLGSFTFHVLLRGEPRLLFTSEILEVDEVTVTLCYV
jgi:hypothetical protein